jgi:hypothetical protein
MTTRHFLQKAKKFEIQAYQKPKHLSNLRKTHVAFSGSPYKHPTDPEKIILILDPYSTHTIYYEFKAKDIAFVEELSNIVTMDEKTMTMVRIWVKKMSVGVQCSPFLVGDTAESSSQ